MTKVLARHALADAQRIPAVSDARYRRYVEAFKILATISSFGVADVRPFSCSKSLRHNRPAFPDSEADSSVAGLALSVMTLYRSSPSGLSDVGCSRRVSRSSVVIV